MKKKVNFVLLLLLSFLIIRPLVSAEIIDLEKFEKHVTCQNGEDGVLEKIASLLTLQSGYYVEFDYNSDIESNTRFLKERYGWHGLLLAKDYENPKINLHREFITAGNIHALLQKYQVPGEFDLLSIDMDYNDFYVWHALSNLYSPKVVVIEYNASHLPQQDRVAIQVPHGGWDGTNYFGASILALYQLGRSAGYSLVYAAHPGVNLFFIRDDIIYTLEEEGITFKDLNDVNKIYKAPAYGIGSDGGHRPDPQNRPYLAAKDILD